MTALNVDDMLPPRAGDTVKVVIYNGVWSILFVDEPGDPRPRHNTASSGIKYRKNAGLGLPGGQIRAGETLRQATLREIEEETRLVVPRSMPLDVLAFDRRFNDSKSHTLYLVGGFFWNASYGDVYDGPSIKPDGPFSCLWVDYMRIRKALQRWGESGFKGKPMDSESGESFFSGQFSLLCSSNISNFAEL